MANDYDFQINDLKFRAAITDETPYQRATAPFRKEQFDAAPTVGDQSLTGWWTRGQLSFHKGAGIKFYEVLDGDTILNRFQDSDAVDVWTAGQASLTPSLADLAVAATSATPGTLSGVAGLFYTDGSTGMKFYDGAGTTAITTSDSGVPTEVTSDGRGYLAVNGSRIEKQSYSGVERTNHVTNPSFETNTTGWTLGTGDARDTTKSKYGTASLKVAADGGGGLISVTGLTVGATYIASAWFWSPGGATYPVSLVMTTTLATSTVTDAWTRIQGTFTATATSHDFAFAGPAGSFFDGCMVTEFPLDLDYFDGSTNGGTWSGTANASKSTYAESSTLRTNYVTNPNFETNTTGWTDYNANGTVLTRDTAQFYSGVAGLRASGGTNTVVGHTLSGLTIGATYVVKMRLKSTTPLRVGVDGNSLTTSGTGSWELAELTFTTTQTGPDLAVMVADLTASTFYVDNVMLTEFPFDGDYFDGSSPGGSWTGTANASTSTYATSNPAASYVLWEHGDAGYVFEDIWWAKGRIWAVDNTGRWYTLSPAGGTVHTTDALWTSGKSNGDWSLADSPSAVFIGEAGTIYSLTVDVDGAAVNLTAPVVAAILPAGENISSLYHYLGYLVITTNKGVRVAQVQDAQLIYGPLVITGDFSINNQTGAGGNLVYVVGQPTGHSTATVCVLDLTEEVTTLRPAWAPWKDLNNGAPSVAGALIDPANRLFAYAGNLYGSGTTMSPDGYIGTGFHRFGTLDPKAFQTVSVRCGGDGGSITVARVDADGTMATLGTVTPAEASKDFSLGLTSGTERVALRFTLTRDGTDSTKGPELLGYQIKALPVPERQRLLKWPLSLVDKTQLRRGMKVGKAGAAYTAVKALEALESSNAVVTYTDHRTGETGTAYVDAVEFQSNTPSTATSNGFGGIGYVTLRVLT